VSLLEWVPVWVPVSEWVLVWVPVSEWVLVLEWALA
jgi:hypothetical protein